MRPDPLGDTGPSGRLFPWGNDASSVSLDPTPEMVANVRARDDSVANAAYREHSEDVRSRPDLQSELGLYHTLRNVHEWTASYDFDLGAWYVKGHSWATAIKDADLTDSAMLPDRHSYQLGFRCAVVAL